MTENFSDVPKSLSEARADKERNAALWTPRDALVSLLREIDSGNKDIEKIVICYTELHPNGGATKLSYHASGARSYWETLGLLTEFIHLISSR